MHAATRLLLSVVAALALVLVAAPAVAQGVPASEARAFIGKWNMQVQADQPVTIALDIHDHGGQLGAMVAAQGVNTMVTNIVKSGESLVLSYTLDVGGEDAPITIKLTPAETGLAGELDVADGMFTTSGPVVRQ